MKILCVCLGNICRSPMAEVVLKKIAQERALNWTIRSAGTNRYHKGGPADERSVQVCAENGLDLSLHIARRLTSDDFVNYDILFSMASDVTEEMEIFLKDDRYKTKIVNFMDVLYPNQNQSVPDPWYGGIKDFRSCFDLVQKASELWVEQLLKRC